jgi:hypothetical protein
MSRERKQRIYERCGTINEIVFIYKQNENETKIKINVS